MNLTKKAEQELQKAVQSQKVQTEAIILFESLKTKKFTNADILALGLLITQTARNVLEGKAKK